MTGTEQQLLEVVLNIQKQLTELINYNSKAEKKRRANRKPKAKNTMLMTNMDVILPEMVKVLSEFSGECSLNRMAVRIAEHIKQPKKKVQTIRNLMKVWLKNPVIYSGVRISLINKAKPTFKGAGTCLYWITGTKMSTSSKNDAGYLIQDGYSDDSTAPEIDIFS